MADYLIQGETLTGIANAIREKANISSPLYPDSMPSYIRSIQTSSSDTSEIPDYVVTEGKRVASGMVSKRGANSLTAVIMSDMHEMGDGDHTDSTIIERYRRANRNAGQGAKVVADNIDIDFFANLGDLAWGEKGKTTIQDYVKSIVNARKYMYDVEKDHETFITPGNHDTGTYSVVQNGVFLSSEILEGLIGTYRYVDFADKKVRVICLNTADVDGFTTTENAGTERISGEQLQWFANALDLSSKSDASNWGIIIMSHHPLDWGTILPAANCLQAYLSGTSFSVTHNGVAVSKNFSGKNAAKVICQFHGHVHGFRVDNIRYGSVGSLNTMAVKRIAIPNACFARTNEYGENTGTDSNGLEYGSTPSYEKVDGAEKNTSFCLVSIDLDNEIIYADCYGAGEDRVISYAEEVIVTYSITNTLSNATTSNGTSTVTANSPYSAAISATNGYEISSIKVTMGGTDITASAVSGNNISISKVTGNVVITVSTVQAEPTPAYTNLVTSSIDSSGNKFNGKGYKENYRLGSSGSESQTNGAVVSGFIPYNGQVVRSWGATSSSAGSSGNYVGFYDASFTKLLVVAGTHDGVTYSAVNGKYQMMVDPSGMPTSNQNLAAQAKYIRCSLAVCADPTIFTVTLGEPIE